MKKVVSILLVAMLLTPVLFAGNSSVIKNDAKSNRQLWQQRTKGKNLALGKRVKFNPAPNYKLTAQGEVAGKVLTDGKLGRHDDRLWFAKSAVAWVKAGVTSAALLIDLEKTQPVAKVVIRLNGGLPATGVRFPQQIEVFVSKDGKKFYPAQKLIKLEAADEPDWQTTYYLPADGTPYAYPFEFKIEADVKYVGIQISGITIPAITDEIAVIKADKTAIKSSGFNAVYSKATVRFWEERAIFTPKTASFYIADNVNAPNWLQFTDQRRNKQGKLGYIIDMPKQIELKTPATYPLFVRKLIKTEKNGLRTLRTFTFDRKLALQRSMNQAGPLYFSLKSGSTIPESERYVIITTTENGKTHYTTQMPLKLLHIKPVPQFKRLNISLSWMYVPEMEEWPNFFADWRTLGFNAISVMPNANDSAQRAANKLSFLNKSKQHGFKTINVQSPLGMVPAIHPKATEHRCLSSKTRNSFCPAYRGPIYVSLFSDFRKIIKKYPTDYLFFDIETWYNREIKEGMKCSRCNAKRIAAGQSWKEYFTTIQVDFARKFKAAIVEAYGKQPLPLIGYYGSYPGRSLIPVAGGVPFMPFELFYPQYDDIAQPSLYTSDTRRIKSVVAQCYAYTKKTNTVIPWLTAGTHGEYAADKLEAVILETLLNGAGGFTYFRFWDFDTPLDFYYHTKALNKIAPYEALLMDGSPIKVAATNRTLSYSAVRHENKMLLLVGNYRRINQATTVVTLPFKKVLKVVDLNSGKPISATIKLSISLPPDGFSLFYIDGQ
jgi:hypothetical protein